MILLIIFSPLLLQSQISPDIPIKDWVLVVALGLIVTALAVIITFSLNKHLGKADKLYEEKRSSDEKYKEDRLGRIENNIKKLCDQMETIQKMQSDFNAHILLQKEKNVFYTNEIEDVSEKINRMSDQVNKMSEQINMMTNEVLKGMTRVSRALLKIAGT